MLLIGARGVFVDDVVAPLGFGPLLPLGEGLGHREVGHEVLGGGSVPVPFIRRGVDGVPGTDLGEGVVPGLHVSTAVRDVQRLPVRVAMPGGVRAGGEADERDAESRRRFACRDDVEPYISGEPLGRALGARLFGIISTLDS